MEVEINKKSHCGDVNGKVPSTPFLSTFFRSPALPAVKPASDRLRHGQVYRGRCGEEKKMQAQHANQVFPLLALGSKDS